MDERLKQGERCGTVAVGVNFVLGVTKAALGIALGSVTVTADGFNNAADAAGGIITTIGFRSSGKAPDAEHPYGHGRYEHIAGLVVAFLVLLLGFELCQQSFLKTRADELVPFDRMTAIVLALSIAVKIALGLYCRNAAKKIDSKTIAAIATDSFSDCAATAVALVSLVFGERVYPLPLDGLLGMAVSVFIIYNGIKILKDAVSPLLGEKPAPELVEALKNKILSYEYVQGVHDMMIHDYGPGALFASVHVEMPEELPVCDGHEVVDRIELDVGEELGIKLTLHYDPLCTCDGAVKELQHRVEQLLPMVHPALMMHDFRVVLGQHHRNLIFDIVVPHGFALDKDTVRRQACALIEDAVAESKCVIKVEESYV
ncbi:MAG: cation diffusion facilitator family transporter [Oscillospiraceae bacterium]|jgi:cation diffusion facilitator family transporter|nr:cation diffusion facilitator family transporter [Oscillospiraceae bacterium]